MSNAPLLLKNQLVKKIEARDELFLRQARDGNFKSFCLYMDYNFFARRVVLGKVADVLQKVHDAFRDGNPIKVAISLPPRAGKCLHPDTVIYTPNAPIKIKDIDVGQEVISYCGGSSKIETVIGISKSVKKQVRIEYATGESIITSPEHRLLTDTGYKEAKDITASDFLIGYEQEKFFPTQITSIVHISEEIEMYDIQTTGVNNFVANGIVSHNSYIVSLFAAFMLGRFPTESVMRNSCTAKLYEKLSKDTRDIVDSDKFRSIFQVVLETKGVVSWGLTVARQTSYFGAGVDGTIIGFGATMLAISDDLYKGIADALSDVINDFVLGWYDAAASSRIEKNCCVVDIGTRWRSNDVIGRNEAAGKYDFVIKIPALTLAGESFCDDVRTTDQYMDTKNSIAEEIWDAEYMQEPKDIKGALFRKDELEYYRKSDIQGKEFDANVGVCDMADEGSDNLSAPMVKKIGGRYYLYNVLFTTERTEVTEPLLIGELRLNNVHMMRFESNNGGKLFAQNVAEGVETEIDWKTTTSNKETRILVDSGWIKKNIVFLAEDEYPKHSDYARFMDNLTKYVKGVKNTHDDAPDSLSLLRRWLDEIGLNNCDDPIPERDRWSSSPVNVTQMQL